MHDDHETADDTTRADIPVLSGAPASDLLEPAGEHHAGAAGFRPPPWAEPETPEIFVPMPVAKLRKHDRVILYGSIVELSKEPFRHTPLDKSGPPCEASGSWVHLRYLQDGHEHPTAERADDLVAVSRLPHG